MTKRFSVAAALPAIACVALLVANRGQTQPPIFTAPTPSVTDIFTEPHVSDWGYVTRFSTAWANDAMAVYHQPLGASGETVSALTFCRVTTDGYATDPGQPGHQLQHAAVLAAYLHHKQVQLLVQGCAYDKPRIISVGVRD